MLSSSSTIHRILWNGTPLNSLWIVHNWWIQGPLKTPTIGVPHTRQTLTFPCCTGWWHHYSTTNLPLWVNTNKLSWYSQQSSCYTTRKTSSRINEALHWWQHWPYFYIATVALYLVQYQSYSSIELSVQHEAELIKLCGILFIIRNDVVMHVLHGCVVSRRLLLQDGLKVENRCYHTLQYFTEQPFNGCLSLYLNISTYCQDCPTLFIVGEKHIKQTVLNRSSLIFQ